MVYNTPSFFVPLYHRKKKTTKQKVKDTIKFLLAVAVIFAASLAIVYFNKI